MTTKKDGDFAIVDYDTDPMVSVYYHDRHIGLALPVYSNHRQTGEWSVLQRNGEKTFASKASAVNWLKLSVLA